MTPPDISIASVLEPGLRPRNAAAGQFLSAGAAFEERGRDAPEAVRVINVMLVEHQALFRYFLKQFINRMPGYYVVGDYASTALAEAACGHIKPDLAIIDFLGWESSLTTLVASLRRANPHATALVLTASVEPYYLEQAFAANVSGVVDKNVGLDLLERAIKAVGSGRQFFSPEATLVWRELLRRKSDALSDREREVLREIARGKYSKEVATSLNVSVFTVENIRRRIMKKTGLRSVAELALHAVRVGLVPAPRSVLAAPAPGR